LLQLHVDDRPASSLATNPVRFGHAEAVNGKRFEGAITTPADGGEVADASIAPEPERPPRPPSIEIAGAILIVGGLANLITGPSPFQPGMFPLAWLILGLNALTIVVGIQVRRGRNWMLAINLAALALFLELTAFPSPIAIAFAILDSIVLFGLIRNQAWFAWPPPEVDRR
jgi:hypothetical protein